MSASVLARSQSKLLQALVLALALLALVLGIERYTTAASSQTLPGAYEGTVLPFSLPADAISGQPNFTR